MSDTTYPSAVRAEARSGEWLGVNIVSGALFVTGGALQVWYTGSVAPLLFILLISAPVILLLMLRGDAEGEGLAIFVRSISVGLLAAGIATYYVTVLFDYYQLASDASSFYELSSQAGRARTLQDLRTITEGAGAVVLWSRFYDVAALLGFAREPYIGISMNILMIAIASVVCAKSARVLYGKDERRSRRLVLFFTISGMLWLFAGIHIRDSVIFLAIVVLAHFWIAYLAQMDRAKLLPALVVTGLMMPALQVLRAEFFYIPLLIAVIALGSLNMSRGRGDSRFIMLVSLVSGAVLLVLALLLFGEEVQTLFTLGQETYSTLSLEEARSGSLGVSLIIDQAAPIRLLLGIPYLFYFPIPFWTGFSAESALQLFKSINALSFYLISSFAFLGVLRIAVSPVLRSPAFLFIAVSPFAVSALIALTSLESRHLGAFMSFFFLLGLLPDLRNRADSRLLRLILMGVLITMALIHAVWFALRYV